MITPASIGLPPKFSRFRPEVKQEETILSIASATARFNILQAPPGCLSADTLVQISRGSGIRISRKFTLRKAYQSQFDPRRNPSIDTYTQSLVGGFIQNQKIERVFYSGKKLTYSLILENGRELKGTEEHPILTENGFIGLAGLTSFDKVICDFGLKSGDTSKKIDYKHVQGMRYHPFAQQNFSNRIANRRKNPEGQRFRVALHRVVVEADLNGIKLIDFIRICRTEEAIAKTLTYLDPKEFAVHHIDSNSKNNDLSNLCVLTHSQHALEHDPVQRIRRHIGSVRVKFVRRCSVEETYDICCGDGEPNFVANGIVVHNSGKSLICPSVGLLRGDRILYLTKSKSLQRQLYHDMSSIGLIDIVGHSNYPCANVKYDPTGEMADLICEGRRKINGRGHCHYDELVVKCNDSNFVSTNYAHWVQTYLSNDPDRLGKFDLLICDEAHNIASGSCLLGDLVSIKFFSPIEKFGIYRFFHSRSTTIESAIDWARESLDLVRLARQRAVDSRCDYRDLLVIDRLLVDLRRLIDEHQTADFVIIPFSSGVQFKPTNIANYTETYLFRNISSILLCSATIFREDIELLGIDSSNCTFHEVSSSFSWKRRPFIYFSTIPPIKCDRSMGDGEKRIWVDRLDLLMQVEPGKGIIQSRSYDRAEDILSRSRLHKQIIAYDRSTSREAIEKFRLASPPCTLIGPTIEEGEDFPGDLCSYVIWPKVPFLNSYDPFISRMKEKDKDYTNREVCRSIIQGSLRGMRFAEDWCRIWMIDKHWLHFRKQPYFFSWFRKAFMIINGLNEMPREPKESQNKWI